MREEPQTPTTGLGLALDRQAAVHRTVPSRTWIVAAALALVCSLSWLHQAYYDFENDDAYISYRYARHWAEGLGPVFNPGERVEGYSNFLLVAALALVVRLGGDVVVAARLLGTLGMFGVVLLGYALLRLCFRRDAALAVAGGLALALHGGLAAWARSGMETVPLACMLLLAQFVFLGELERRQQHWRSGLLFAVVALLRADGFLHGAATALFLLPQRQHRRRLLGFALAFAALVLPYFLWRWQYYGHFFPNPYYLRTGGDLHQQLRGIFYVHNFVVPFGGVLLFALPLLLLWLREPARDAARAYLATCVTVFGAYIVWVGGDYMPMGRFFVPNVAALVCLQLEAVAAVASRLVGRAAGEATADSRRGAPQPATSAAPRPVVAGILAACIALSGLMPTLNPRRQPQNRAILARVQVEQWTLAGRWLAAHVAPGKLLAAEPVGALGYYSRLPIIDMLGVNDTHIAHLDTGSLGHSTAGHEKRDFEYVLSRRPQLIFRGVGPQCSGDGEVRRYADGSSYTCRCIPLGSGPDANNLGEVQQAPLFLRYEDRDTGSN